ncbi:hypothetical protein BN946_scf184940.g37 [Trametes cinnabarina]|uniref:Uncharacterized protein n=1 Tax=Pycnoporus cinnabarinus TaxID=5643 RepID=A0A060SC11_PYCCI|nr:hypothetical protein BN946_scf184940.g37 [Trametes cinnabarina]
MTFSDVNFDCSSASLQDDSVRVRLPFPFPHKDIVNTVEFSSGGSPGVGLDTWIKLSEKRQTHRCLDSPEDSLEELILDRTILYQCQWPGYDPHTCFVPVPTHIEDGTDVLKKGDLLDMICEVLACWILRVMRCGHVKCTEPQWAIGVNNITFKHVYIVAVVEVQGYMPKWVPVLEVDSNIFGQ